MLLLVKRVMASSYYVGVPCNTSSWSQGRRRRPCSLWDVPSISYNSLQRAQTTIEDFSKTYFLFHGLQQSDFFKFMPIMIFIEAKIYQMDEENEKLAFEGDLKGTEGKKTDGNEGDENDGNDGIGSDTTEGSETNQKRRRIVEEAGGKCGENISFSKDITKTWPMDDVVLDGETVLLEMLKSEDLIDDHIKLELEKGKTYWSMERRLCQDLLSGKKVNVDDVFAASENKSFDYRLLNMLLYKLTNRPYDVKVFEFLFYNEHLVDIHDDLFDYEDDVLKGSFNVFRMLVNIYGAEEGRRVLYERIGYFEQKQEEAMCALPQDLQDKYKKKEAESYVEFGEGSSRWIFPPAITDEEAYRKQVNEDNEGQL